MKTDLTQDISSANDKILSEANRWLMQIKAEALTPETEGQFHAWLAEDPEHKARFDLMSALWDGTDILRDDPLALGDLAKDRKREPAISRRWWSRGEHLSISKTPSLAAAAAVLLVFVGIWLLRPDTAIRITHRTGIGEQKTVYLTDGSTVYLDTETELSGRYSEDSRQIDFRKGRASFTVAHDPERPFLVTADRVTIRAIGTRFSIYKERKGRISVSVTQGRVEVSRIPTQQPTGSVEVSLAPVVTPDPTEEPVACALEEPKDLNLKVLVSGQKVVVEEQKATLRIEAVDVKRIEAWKQGRLSFYLQPLSKVIDEINRYLEGKIHIEDPRLNDLVISINFNIAHRNHFLRTLEKTIPIESHVTSDGRIVIAKREES